MIKINKIYLESVKQELVNDVAITPNIIPEIFVGYDLPKPTVTLKFQKEKLSNRINRRKEISKIWNENAPSKAIKLIEGYHEQELSEFLVQFPKYDRLLQKSIFQRVKEIIQR